MRRSVFLIALLLVSLWVPGAAAPAAFEPITHGMGFTGPVFGPDGRIAVAAARGEKPYHIEVMTREGKDVREVTHMAHDMQPAWSPDGRRLAFASYGQKGSVFAIWTVDADGRDARRLLAPAAEGDQYPVWSPDGRRIVFTHGQRLWGVNADGTGGQPLFDKAPGSFQYAIGFSHDGKWLAWLSADSTDASGGSPYRLWVGRADGGDARPLAPEVRASAARWGPGASVYYTDGSTLSAVDVMTGKTRKLRTFTDWVNRFDISRDGRWMVYDNQGPGFGGNVFVGPVERGK